MTDRDEEDRESGSGSFSLHELAPRLALPLLMVLLGIAGIVLLKDERPVPAVGATEDVAGSADDAGAPIVLAYASAPVPPEGVVVPAGMIYIPGGRTHIGAEDGLPAEQPVFTADVAPCVSIG
jgi:hypothetical protein